MRHILDTRMALDKEQEEQSQEEMAAADASAELEEVPHDVAEEDVAPPSDEGPPQGTAGEGNKKETGAQDVSNEEPERSDDDQQEMSAPSTSPTGIEKLFANKVFGTLVYVYFGLFVAFHVVVGVQFFIETFYVIVGIALWAIIMILGGVSVVLLTVWRDRIATHFDELGGSDN